MPTGNTDSSDTPARTPDADAVAALGRGTLLALLEATRSLVGALEMGPVLERVAAQAALVLGCEGASVLLYDATRRELVFQAATGPVSGLVNGVRFDAALGIAGHALRIKRAVRVDDVRGNGHFFDGIDAKTNNRTRGLMAAPLIHRGQVLGVLEVINPLKRKRFSDRDVELLEIFANLAAIAAGNAHSFEEVNQQNRALRVEQAPARFIGQAGAFTQVVDLCRKVARAGTTVLLTGETGTGKEMAAREVHAHSPRRDKPFVAVNCAALPESLLESELFGHEKGAFTDASARRQGRFELAHGGTLLLDEIGEMSPSLQVKLLRVLQERCFERVGGTRTISCDVRLIAATNADLEALVADGGFREDLYYRIHVFPIHLPPLRDRIDDLPLLTEHFLKELAPSLSIEAPAVSPEAMACLMKYHWPGNIRELRNVIERSTLLSGGYVTPQSLPPEIAACASAETGMVTPEPAKAPSALPSAKLPSHGQTPGETPGSGAASGGSRLEQHERGLLATALESHRWNQSAAARSLGISRDVLRYRIKKHGLRPRGSARAPA